MFWSIYKSVNSGHAACCTASANMTTIYNHVCMYACVPVQQSHLSQRLHTFESVGSRQSLRLIRKLKNRRTFRELFIAYIILRENRFKDSVKKIRNNFSKGHICKARTIKCGLYILYILWLRLMKTNIKTCLLHFCIAVYLKTSNREKYFGVTKHKWTMCTKKTFCGNDLCYLLFTLFTIMNV